MSDQLSYRNFSSKEPQGSHSDISLRLLNWNIRNPSLARAKQQALWIQRMRPNVIMLTEAKNSAGCLFLQTWLENAGFQVIQPITDDDYCVILAANLQGTRQISLRPIFLPQRIVAIRCQTNLGDLAIVGLYVPSRGPLERRNVNKKIFQNQVTECLASWRKSCATEHFILGGDFNVLDRDHMPYYSLFREWEYEFYDTLLAHGLTDAFKHVNGGRQDHSWFGRGGNGYRFDHLFVSPQLLPHVHTCTYRHKARTSGLSDHSAMCLDLRHRKPVVGAIRVKRGDKLA